MSASSETWAILASTRYHYVISWLEKTVQDGNSLDIPYLCSRFVSQLLNSEGSSRDKELSIAYEANLLPAASSVSRYICITEKHTEHCT